LGEIMGSARAGYQRSSAYYEGQMLS